MARRLLPHSFPLGVLKKVSLIVQAFNRLSLPLVIVGDGPDYSRTTEIAGPTVRLLGWQPDAVVTDLMERARAFVYMAEEDFGIAIVEAQAAGTPLIAYRRGGGTETVLNGVTGLLCNQQNCESLEAAVREF
jgi:glycosyltransferase involved in cell wall biosynthesis